MTSWLNWWYLNWKRGIQLRIKICILGLYFFIILNLIIGWLICKDYNNLIKFGWHFTNILNHFDNSLLCSVLINEEFEFLICYEQLRVCELLLQWVAFKKLSISEQVTQLPIIIPVWFQLIPYLHFIPILLLWGKLLVGPFAYFLKKERFDEQLNFFSDLICMVDVYIDPASVNITRATILCKHLQDHFIFDVFLYDWLKITNPYVILDLILIYNNQFINILIFILNFMILLSAKIIAAGLATISLIGAGVGIGNVFGSFLIAISRNPLLLKTLFTYTILGFALVEAIALFGLMMAFLLLFGL